MVSKPVSLRAPTAPRLFGSSVASYTSAKDCLRTGMVLDPNNEELKAVDAVIRAVVITPANKRS